MHSRLTLVIIAGLLAFAGSESRTVQLETQPPPIAAPATPPLKSFDDLPPTGPTTGTALLERAAITVRPIPLPATKPAHPVTEADLDRAGVLADAYRSAAASAPESCNLDVALLAAIGQIESGSAGGRAIGGDHLVRPGIFGPLLDGGPFAVIRDTDRGRYDGDRVWDRAVGPMQFIPSTWAWAGVDGDGDGKADPQNVYDAAHAAAGYLCRYDRDLSQPTELRAAIWAYNQSHDYVAAVLQWFDYFKGKGLDAVGSVSFRVGSGGRASQLPAVAPTTAAQVAAMQTAEPTTTTTSGSTASPPTATPGPVPTTPTSAPGPSTTTPPPTTGSTPTTTGSTPTTTGATPTTTTTDGTAEPTPTDTETCPTDEPTPSTTPTPATTTPTRKPTPTRPTPTRPTPTTTCSTSPTTATPTPTTTAADPSATETGTTTTSAP